VKVTAATSLRSHCGSHLDDRLSLPRTTSSRSPIQHRLGANAPHHQRDQRDVRSGASAYVGTEGREHVR
jgi:hypothetical protein